MSKWNYISINKDGSIEAALPEEGQEVIITTEGGFVGTDVFDYDYGDEEDGMGCYFEGHDIDEVRAWMPFPEPARPKDDTARILRAVGRYIQTQAEQNGLKALGVNGIVYKVEDVLQELDALIKEEEGTT